MPGRLLAGCYPGDLDLVQMDIKLNALLQSGVRLVVNLMEESEKDHSENAFKDYLPRLSALAAPMKKAIRMPRFPSRDQDIPTLAQMREILSSIHSEIKSGGGVRPLLGRQRAHGHSRKELALGLWKSRG